MADHTPLIEDLTAKLSEALLKKEVTLTPLPIIKYLMKILDVDNMLTGSEKRNLVVEVLSYICAGKDGISGTADDLIPPNILEGIIALITSGVIDEVITLIHTVAVNTVPPIGVFELICKNILKWIVKLSQ